MATANEILESLDTAEIRQRLEAIDQERQALLVLHRAAIRLERKPTCAAPANSRLEGSAEVNPTAHPARDPAPPAAGIVRTTRPIACAALSRETGTARTRLAAVARAGLPMVTLGRERWVLGSDFIELLRRLRDANGNGRPSGSTSDTHPAAVAGSARKNQ